MLARQRLLSGEPQQALQMARALLQQKNVTTPVRAAAALVAADVLQVEEAEEGEGGAGNVTTAAAAARRKEEVTLRLLFAQGQSYHPSLSVCYGQHAVGQCIPLFK